MDGGMVPFRAPLILHSASRSRAARLRDAVLTAMLWCAWAYMLVAALGALWVPPFVQMLLPVDPPERPWEVIRAALLVFAIAATICTAMLLRATFERRRFAGDDRRLAFPRPDDAAIADDFGVDAAALPAWRAARRMVAHHDAAGRVQGMDIGD